MRKPLLMSIALLAAGCLCLWTQDSPENVYLSGHVYESDGKPLPGAKVKLFPLEVGIAGPMPGAITGEDGAYHLVSPALGRTRILASLESRGYPDTFYKLFASPADQFPEVNLVAGATVENVDVHLAPPDGLIEGAVIDRDNGAPIRFARIVLRSVAEPSVFLSNDISLSGHFQYALPSLPISILISAPGYDTWTYKDPSTRAQYLKLSPSERRSVSVELVRRASGPQ